MNYTWFTSHACSAPPLPPLPSTTPSAWGWTFILITLLGSATYCGGFTFYRMRTMMVGIIMIRIPAIDSLSNPCFSSLE